MPRLAPVTNATGSWFVTHPVDPACQGALLAPVITIFFDDNLSLIAAGLAGSGAGHAQRSLRISYRPQPVLLPVGFDT